MEVRKEILVSGIVQGVGFRPYVYRLATERRLNGAISNTASGVTIEVQGPQQTIDEFLLRLTADAPPLARITAISVRDVPCNGSLGFHIESTHRGEPVHTLISPDVAVCDDCLHELLDRGNRRYRYPFINCTNCGPRFTIVRGIPYDRPYTSMASFLMCPQCEAEYHDPTNRRFHAQPNACWQCGPQVQLWGNDGTVIAAEDPIAEAAARLRQGVVIAVKGLGGFHLAVDATHPAAVKLLRERKRRVEKPFAIMVPNLAIAEDFCEVSHIERQTLQTPQRPIVLLRRRNSTRIPEEVAPRSRFLGVFLPYTPLHYLLLAAGKFDALVMTSGNLSEEPIAIDNQEAVRRLGDLTDCLLVHNRDILLRCDDSVVRVTGRTTRQMRRSRGYVPVPVFLKQEVPSILALGGQLKNTICLTKGRYAFLSQHIGDLENLESCEFFEQAAKHVQRILEIEPRVLAHDLHPQYFSTSWALKQKGMQLVGVQHHHAHIASCMAENHLDGQVIGFALDGTGYGTDAKIWGGEVLVAGYRDFQRVAHFDYVALPGGESAIHRPWKMAVSYLHHHFGREFVDLKIPFAKNLDPSKTNLLLQMIERSVNSPLTSSCGRLFDAVAALIGVRQQVNYEAQAAIELEMAMAEQAVAPAYSLDLRPSGDTWIFDTHRMFAEIIEDLRDNKPIAAISRRFHDGLVTGFVQMAVLVREKTLLARVCLSGGTFQNTYLLTRLEKALQEERFEVFTHREVPAGDGGLSLGQAMVAAHRLG